MGMSIKHPWNRWFSRVGFTLKRGVEFDCQVHSMAQQVRNQAVKRRVRVSIAIRDDVISVINLGIDKWARGRSKR